MSETEVVGIAKIEVVQVVDDFGNVIEEFGRIQIIGIEIPPEPPKAYEKAPSVILL